MIAPRAARVFTTSVVAVGLLLLPHVTLAQRGGGGRGASGGGTATVGERSRLDALDFDLTLTKEQRKNIKTILDEAQKNAVPVRDALLKAHTALGAAVQAGKDQTEIDAASKTYGEQAAAMTALEMQALADVLKTLTDEQRANKAAVSHAFFLLRGAFIGKKWDDIPDARLY